MIELLIVIGILGILVVAVLLTLNPAEGQRKARDAQRMKDLATLQSVMDQAVADNVFTASFGPVNSGDGTDRACSSGGWLSTADLCKYVTNLPADPTAKSTTVAGADGGGACTNSTSGAKNAYYYVQYDHATQTYEINVRQESTSNCKNLTGDGGNSSWSVEAGTYSGLSLIGANN